MTFSPFKAFVAGALVLMAALLHELVREADMPSRTVWAYVVAAVVVVLLGGFLL